MASSNTEQEVILTAADVPELTAPALASQHARVRGFLARLADDPPQVLLLEGGTSDERVSMAHYWAAMLNCPRLAATVSEAPLATTSATLPTVSPQIVTEMPLGSVPDSSAAVAATQKAPCLVCETCIQIFTRNHRDLFLLDGRTGAIKIDDVRGVRAVLGEPPRGDGYRVVILAEAQALGIEAANALLKSLEEPRPGTRFVLLAPQRERLLPTLVSRSWVLTLAWPDTATVSPDADVQDWAQSLAEFLTTNTGWFSRTSAKGALDIPLAQRLVAHCQRELVNAIAQSQSGHQTKQQGQRQSGPLATVFAKLDPGGWRMLDEALAECIDSLNYMVNPATVLDWLATRIILLLKR